MGKDKKYVSTELEPLAGGGVNNGNNPWWHESATENAAPRRTCCDLFSFILFVIIASAAFAAGAVALGSGAYWVHELKGRPMTDCMIIMLTAALPLGLGAFNIVLLGGITFISACFCVLPHSSLSGRSCWGKITRVFFLHIVPFLCLCTGIACAIVALYFSSMARQIPDMNKGFTSVKGIDGPITISRDPNGLVHILASSRGDALFGQGLAHGQDRLWQIEFQRLVGKGRLSEYVGSAGVKMDKQIRTLGFPQGAQLMCDNASPENVALSQRYIDGLNFYISNYDERPAEFLFMGKSLLKPHVVEPFERVDSCLIAMLLMWQMGANVPTEIQRFNVFWNTDRTYSEVDELYNNMTNITGTILSAEQLGLTEEDAIAARAREANDSAIEGEFYDSFFAALREQMNPNRIPKTRKVQSRKMGVADAPADAEPCPTCQRPSVLKEKVLDLFDTSVLGEFNLLDFNVRHASNSWGGRSPGGNKSAVGASDPHLAINVPSVWYWSHMTYPDSNNKPYDAAGVGLPGLPGVHIGKTTTTSWGITMSMTDLSDLWLITPDPQQPTTHYLWHGLSFNYNFRTEVINVKGGDTITLRIPETIYGPVATEALGLPAGLQFAIRADFLRNDTSSLDGLMCLNDPATLVAMDVRDYCLSKIRSPGFSIPIEDSSGNIAYSMTGHHPIRYRGHTGKFPTIGNGSFDYVDWIPFTELPTLTIPTSTSDLQGGYVSAANQKTYPDGYKYSLGYDFCYPYRGWRLHEVLSDPAALGSLSSADFHIKLQRDVRSNIAVQWVSEILNTSYYTSNNLPIPAEVAQFHVTLATSATATDFYNELIAWDKLMTIGSTTGTLFWRWWRELMATPTDVIAALNRVNSDDDEGDVHYWSDMQQEYPIFQLRNPTETMTLQCKNYLPTSAAVAGCGDLAAKLLISLVTSPSASASQNRWGIDYNRLTTKHLMLQNTPLACLYQRTINKDGDGSSIDVSDFDLEGKFPGSFASSMRQIYDWGAPTWIHFTFPGGESGNPFSQFFQNFLDPYSNDEYVKVTTTGAPVLGGTVFSQVLTP